MDELVAWYRQQLDDDEREAKESAKESTRHLAGADPEVVGHWHVVERAATGTFVATRDQWGRVAEVFPTYGGAHADHIARHGPAAVLADIEAKRAVLDYYEHIENSTLSNPSEYNTAGAMIDMLARGYRHRPGWKQEWEA